MKCFFFMLVFKTVLIIINFFQGLNMTSKRTEKQECVLTTETESIRTEYYR